MGTKITSSFLLIFFATIGIAQTRKQIQGKIIVADAKPSGVFIINLNTEEEVVSDKEGFFFINATVDDLLVFSAEHLSYMRKIIDEDEMQTARFSVEMTSRRLVLDEVEILNNNTYNAVDLGILQKPAKSYTPAERRLKTAGDFKPIHLLGLLGGSLQLDPIINAINGKTKRLKNEILLERNTKRLADFQAWFSEDELIQQLEINPHQVNEFCYFVLEEEEFIMLMDIRDKNKMLFYLIQKYSSFEKIKRNDDKE